MQQPEQQRSVDATPKQDHHQQATYETPQQARHELVSQLACSVQVDASGTHHKGSHTFACEVCACPSSADWRSPPAHTRKLSTSDE